MAIVVCEKHSREGAGALIPTEPEFVGAMDSVGYPNSAAICFVPGCGEPGWVFFEQSEADAFRQGQRIFTATFPDQFMKVRCVGPEDAEPIARPLNRG
jgi:hypothetical protein